MNTILITTIALTSAFNAYAFEQHQTPRAAELESQPIPIESVIETIELNAEQLLQTRLSKIASNQMFDAEATSRLGWKESKTLRVGQFHAMKFAMGRSPTMLP